ncbi:MAG TPA: outer membrane protein assembly factor BamB [Burkholderiales bacterium]|nr:outer membrane protein assembly factor BamB [Burkholderiales bacterium]
MRCRFLKAASPLLALLLCACGLLGLSGDDENTVDQPAPLVAFRRAARTEVLWQKGIGESGEYVFTPAFADDSVYAANEAGDLLRYNAKTGKLIWRVDTRRNLSAGVGAAHNLVLVGDLRGELLAFDNEGYLIWKSRLTSEILSAPQVANGIVVVRTEDGRIFGLNAADGSRKWVYEHATPTLTVRSFAGVAITRGGVFAGLAGGKLVALDIETGNIGWEATVAVPRGTTELERVTDITSTPAVDDERVCAVAYQGRVGCFDLFRGSLLWARDVSSISGLTLDDHNLYVSDDKGAVVALDKVSGASVWKQDKLFGRRISAPLVIGNYIVVGDLHGYVHFMSREDGSFAARRATDGSRISAPPIALDNGVLIQTRDGGLYAMNVEPLS